MKSTSIVSILIAGSALLLSSEAEARGCLAGAAAGGAVGHVAGHHAILGAAAGCAINRHRDAVKDRKAAAAQQAQTPRATAPALAPVAPSR
jgi:hypothetical protein